MLGIIDHKRWSRKRKNEGFTLIELLLAIFIFGLVVSAVYGAYQATFYVVNSTEKKMATAGKALAVLERITDDLSSLVQSNTGFLTGERQESSGMRGDSLSFISAVHIGLTKKDDMAGYSSIQYLTEVDEDTGLLKLYRSGTPLLPGQMAGNAGDTEAMRYLLCDGLKEVKFSYFNEDGVESEEWRSEDDEAVANRSFPVMVTIVLQFAESTESDQISFYTTSVALVRTNG